MGQKDLIRRKKEEAEKKKREQFRKMLAKRTAQADDILALEQDLIKSRTAQLKLHLYQHTIRQINFSKRLFTWLDKVEGRLFSPDMIEIMEPSDLINLYKILNTQVQKSFDDTHKLDQFLVQMDQTEKEAETIVSEESSEEEKEKSVNNLKRFLMDVLKGGSPGPVVDAEISPEE